MNKYLVKCAEMFAHATSEDNLHHILQSGKIKSLRQVAIDNPRTPISVEPTAVPILRKSLEAGDAVDLMQGVKDVRKVFLTRGGYLGNYGENVIVKSLVHPKERLSLNTIPNEFTSGRHLSIKNNATVYVPDTKVVDYQNKYPGISFKPKSELDLPEYSLSDRIKHYPGKLAKLIGLQKQSSESLTPGKIGSTAFLAGSTGLGINVDDSDVDIFVPYTRKEDHLKAVARVLSKYPNLSERESTSNNPNKTTLSGFVDGKDVDVVIGSGAKAIDFKKAYINLRESLDEETKANIKRRKAELKSSYLLPKLRYNLYKRTLDDTLGLKQYYF